MFSVLHALRLKGLAEVARIARAIDVPAAEVEEALKALAHDGLVRERHGRLTGWMLTPAGRSRAAALVATELSSAGVRDRIEDVYRRFLPLNREVLELCTDWQVREEGGNRVLNDHSDAVYDERILGRLHVVHGAAEPMIEAAGAALPRFKPYLPRLRNALALVDAGDYEWMTQPGVDSYHTVWFELHEDLLSTLGIERSKEEPS